jgi:Helicase HerA, central domain
VEEVTTADLDYLQRTGLEPPPLAPGAQLLHAPPALRRLLTVNGVGRLEKPSRGRDANAFRLVTEDLLVGLYNYKIPLAFHVGARPGRVAVSIGTWLPEGAAGSLQDNHVILQTALQALYPSIETAEDLESLDEWPRGGLVLGVPTAKPPDSPGDGLPLDRLLRALAGTTWAALILAQPVEEEAVRDLRLRLINEMRSAETPTKLAGVPSPLVDHYLKLLDLAVRNHTLGQAVGAWRTAVYLLGEETSYYRLASVWRGVFAGEDSVPEPVRVWDRTEVPALAADWAMPEPFQGPRPGLFPQPFDHQTLLISPQLAAYVHFPDLETSGFAVRTVPDFDAVPPKPATERPMNLGQVLERGRPAGAAFAVDVERLTRHTFVTGVTGSGKTNTVFHMLSQAVVAGVPFLVLEPAKTEYRVLLHDAGLGEELQVFTLGDETVSPFRLNPFEVPDGTDVATHLDLLRSVFHVSFGMWTPLPQVLEICLHEIYLDHGWDVTSNTNRRLTDGTDRASSFPTLAELLAKVDEVVEKLGYEERVTADIRAALQTRLNSLRAGGKGRMLDTTASLPMSLLLGRPTILELEAMGDDDDKAFLMGLVMIRLAEHRRARGDTEGLQHLLVIEEAHRLLGAPSSRREEGEADVRGKAVETFTNLLSEIRAYGQGVIVVDQIPAKVAADVTKNTSLKLAHRIVAGDDRATLGAAMAMNARQEHSLATLPVGQAAAFTDGEDAPLLIQVPRKKGGSQTWPSDSEVREAMSAREELQQLQHLFLPSRDCDPSCLDWPDACETARRLTEDPDVARALSRSVFSAIQTPGGLERTWPELVAVLESRRPPWVDAEALLKSFAVHGPAALIAKRGARAGWSYAETDGVALALRLVFEAQLEGRSTAESVVALRRLFVRLEGDSHGPFFGCERIWGARDGPCLCRHPVAELVSGGEFDELWQEAADADRDAEDGGRAETWAVCQDAAYHTVEFPYEAGDTELDERLADVARCTALCFGQQMLAAQPWSHPRAQLRALDELIDEAGHEESADNRSKGAD